MSGLGDLGATVVDDYGTGYSSLSYLRDLRHISGLKLDRSFVTDLWRPPHGAIVESTVGLAAALGLELVAEGVETAEVRDELAGSAARSRRATTFSRPVPAAGRPSGAITGAALGALLPHARRSGPGHLRRATAPV